MTSWMVVTSPDNLGRTSDLGFSVQGFKTRQRRKVLEQMAPGDNLVYYVSKVQAFAATARVESDGYEDHELIWQSKPGEDYPWRVKISPGVVAAEADWIPSEAVGPGLAYVQKWPAEHWKLAFQGNLHLIPDADFESLEAALTAARGH
ncbi:MAG TPA: EVE domain-containing protein [Acidimicrobiia bacterium]|nr:EVE domain-containing protein [Acidimicrobiia bacterium]